MNLFYKIISTALVMTLLFLMTGCFDYSYIDETQDVINQNEDQEEVLNSDAMKLSLPYIVSDSLDPFEAKTEFNRSLTPLLYDSLFIVDNSFKAVPSIADSFTLKDGILSVTIKKNITFSDLGGLSSNDIVSSFEEAKSSERYKSALSDIKSAVSAGAYTVNFEVTSNDENLCSLLTFPVVKIATKPEDTSKINIPIGSGRYILNVNTNNELYLTANQKHHSKFTPVYKNIYLAPNADDGDVASSFALGYTNVLINSFSDGVYQKYLGASAKHNLTNFVYLVCNSNNKIFEDSNIKRAISLAIDREEICNYAFVSYAKPAVTPFHPEFYELKNYDISELEFNVESSNKILDGIGYDEINTQYNFRHSDGKILEFDLIVNKDNPFKLSAAQLIKDYLKNVSIAINLIPCTQEELIKRVETGRYDIYLGECILANNLNLSVFFDTYGSVSYGIADDCKSKEAYESYLNGETQVSDFVETFNTEMPFIPLLYRCASVNSNSGMSVSCSPIVSDYYNNIDKWKSVND